MYIPEPEDIETKFELDGDTVRYIIALKDDSALRLLLNYPDGIKICWIASFGVYDAADMMTYTLLVKDTAKVKFAVVSESNELEGKLIAEKAKNLVYLPENPPGKLNITYYVNGLKQDSIVKDGELLKADRPTADDGDGYYGNYGNFGILEAKILDVDKTCNFSKYKAILACRDIDKDALKKINMKKIN